MSYQEICEQLDEHAPSYTTVKNLIAEFKRGIGR